MNKRRQPFGYQICGGRVAVKCSEADIVKYIFRAYIGGASFNDIKLNLLKQQVSYDGGKAWNKNMIARILGDRRYVGTDGYPQILLCEEFEAAESIRTSKVSTDTRSEARRQLYKLSDKRPAVQTEADVLGIINALIHDPNLIKEPKTAPEVTETFELQQAFDDLLLVQPIDEVKAKRLIFQMAAAQYSAIDNSEYETTRLQRIMSKHKPLTELDADLLAKIVDKVIVNRISTQVILKNGQIINSEEDYSAQRRTFNFFEAIMFQRKIKNMLKILEYVDISQSLVDEICGFLLQQEFREISIDKKISFLSAQLHKRGKVSKVTATIVEKQLLNYLDQHIHALKCGNNFSVYSETSGYSYYDLVLFISPKGIPVVSRKISLRAGIIIKNEIVPMYCFITDYYWDYMSSYLRSAAREKLISDFQERFSFKRFVSLMNIGVKIDAGTIDRLKKYLWDEIDKERKNTSIGIKINMESEKLYELVQVGYLCLSGDLPHDQFNEYLGITDEFDFAYEYDKFDFSKFDVTWLANLTPLGLKTVCRNKTVKKEIQKILVAAIQKNEIVSQDMKTLTDILIKYFI